MAPPGPPVAPAEWSAAAAPVVARLREAVSRIVNAGIGPTTLMNGELLYEALLGYQYLGDCRGILENLQVPPSAQRPLVRTLERACTRFLQGTSLFTRAVETDRADLLRAAAREALAGDALVQRVEQELEP